MPTFLIGVIAAVILVRLIPRLLAPALVSDTYAHWTWIKRIKKDGYHSTQKMVHYYPLGYHRMLSVLPHRLLMYWEKVNGAFFDGVHVLLFALVLDVFAEGLEDVIVWGWGPLLLGLSPAWLSLGRGPRAYHGTPRVWGELLLSCTFVSLWFFQETASWIWWCGAVGSGAILLLSSKFGTQALVLFCVIVGLLQWSLPVICLPLVCLAGAYLVSKGKYKAILQGHLRHLAWYARRVQRGEMFVAERNSLIAIRRVYRREGIAGALVHLFTVNSVGTGVFQHPLLCVVLILSLLDVGVLDGSVFAWHWLLAGVAIWLLSSTRRLLFIGAAERYLFMVAVAEYFLICQWLASVSPIWRWGFACISVLYCLEYVRQFRFVYGSYYLDSESRKQMIRFLAGLQPARILAFDRAPAWDVAFKTEHEHFMMAPEFGTAAAWDAVFAFDTYPRWTAVSLLGVELILVNRDSITDAVRRRVPVEFPFSDLEKLFDNSAYQVYRVGPAY